MQRVLFAILLILACASPVPARQDRTVEVERLARSSTSWNGAALPAYPGGGPEITILRITVPPGVRLPLHEHPVINAGVLLSGELTVKTDRDETRRLRAGDAIVEVVGVWHYGMNEGNEPAEIIVFYAGVEGEPVTIRKGTEP